MAKSIDGEFNVGNAVLSPVSREFKTAKMLSRNDLCALCLLSVQPLASILAGSEDREKGKKAKKILCS